MIGQPQQGSEEGGVEYLCLHRQDFQNPTSMPSSFPTDRGLVFSTAQGVVLVFTGKPACSFVLNWPALVHHFQRRVPGFKACVYSGFSFPRDGHS